MIILYPMYLLLKTLEGQDEEYQLALAKLKEYDSLQGASEGVY